MHSTESRCVIRPPNILSGGVYVGTFQPGHFTGWGSEGVNTAAECLVIPVTNPLQTKVSKAPNDVTWTQQFSPGMRVNTRYIMRVNTGYIMRVNTGYIMRVNTGYIMRVNTRCISSHNGTSLQNKHQRMLCHLLLVFWVVKASMGNCVNLQTNKNTASTGN